MKRAKHILTISLLLSLLFGFQMISFAGQSNNEEQKETEKEKFNAGDMIFEVFFILVILSELVDKGLITSVSPQ